MVLSTCPSVCPEISGRPLLSCSWVSVSSNRPPGHTSTFYKNSSYSLLFPGGAGPDSWYVTSLNWAHHWVQTVLILW